MNIKHAKPTRHAYRVRSITTLAAALMSVAQVAGAAAQPTSDTAVTATVPAGLLSGKRSQRILEAQVLLDRAHFSPGVIDGYSGGNTRRAVEAYQRANGMAVIGKADEGLIAALRSAHGGETLTRYTVTDADAAGPFRNIPAGMEAMAELDVLAYGSAAEALAERFHMAREFLEALNPGADFAKAGTEIVVVALQDQALKAKVKRIEVDAARARLRAYGSDGKLLASYPATVGSNQFPSPSGSMTVRTLAPEPKYYFSPEGRDWGPDRKLTIAAGPNNPVGSTWIDLSKDGYGIHGTPDPRLIGKTASHGCVRLTNWNARALGQAVEAGTVVEFV